MDELKTMIRALAISNAANGITIAQLSKDFKSLEGYPIPYSKFGFQSLDGMLRTMTDAIQVSGYGPTAVIQPLSNEKSQHVRDMIKMSKPLKKKPSLYNRTPENNFRSNFYNNNYFSHFDDPIKNEYNGKPSNAKPFYTYDLPSNNAQKQQLHNGHRHDNLQKDQLPKNPIQTNKSVTSHRVQPVETTNQRQKSPDEIRNNNLHKDELPKTPIQPYKSIQSPETNNQWDKTPEDTKKPLAVEHKRIDPVFDTANTRSPVVKMNENFYKQTNEVTIPVDAMTVNEKIVDKPLHALLKSDAPVQVVVTSVLNPRHLFVHLKEHTDKLLTLAPYIDQLYSTKLTAHEWFVPEKQITVGLYCAAQYHGRWCRALVISPVNHQSVLLLYIDYGYMRYVPLTEIRFLAKELASIPYQSVRVALKYVKPLNGTWSRECCEQLAKLVHRKVFQMHTTNVDVQENLLEVVLTHLTNDVVHSFVYDSDVGNLNSQLALRGDIVWSAD